MIYALILQFDKTLLAYWWRFYSNLKFAERLMVRVRELKEVVFFPVLISLNKY